MNELEIRRRPVQARSAKTFDHILDTAIVVLEETGWSLSKPRRIGVFRKFVDMPEYSLKAEKVCTIYLAQPACRIGPPREADHSAHWVPQNLVPSLLKNSGDQHFITKYLSRARAG